MSLTTAVDEGGFDLVLRTLHRCAKEVGLIASSATDLTHTTSPLPFCQPYLKMGTPPLYNALRSF